MHSKTALVVEVLVRRSEMVAKLSARKIVTKDTVAINPNEGLL